MVVFNKILQYPVIYSLSQFILAPGAHYILKNKIKQLAATNPGEGCILDIGCGPRSWLWQAGLNPVGLDISFRYSKSFREIGKMAVTGTATDLPFKDNSFFGIWCIGALHHIDATQVSAAVHEMLRAVSADGYIVILDAVLPVNPTFRPIANFIRKKDRGKFMRKEEDLVALLPFSSKWQINRYTYTLTGLEIIECVFQNN